jgi:hypothetical protein
MTTVIGDGDLYYFKDGAWRDIGAAAQLGWPEWIEAPVLVSATTAATAHTMGAWVEVTSSTSSNYDWIGIVALSTFVTATDTRTLLDIGIGASGSETALVESIPVGYSNTLSPLLFQFPVNVPSGSRVAIRIQSSRTSITYSNGFFVQFGENANVAPNAVEALNADRTESRGLVATNGNTPVEIVAATTKPYQALVAYLGGSGDTWSTSANRTMSLFIGPSGNEQQLSVQRFGTTNTEYYYVRSLWTYYVADVPTGTRISVSGDASLGTNGSNYPIVFGVPYP